jgi:hypothetical protein
MPDVEADEALARSTTDPARLRRQVVAAHDTLTKPNVQSWEVVRAVHAGDEPAAARP